MKEGYCVVVYDGSGAPDHLKKAFRLKTYTFETGKEQTVPSDIAGLAEKNCPTGGFFKILKGAATLKPILPATLKAAMKKEAAFHKAFEGDPLQAFADVTPLSKETTLLLTARGGKDVLKAVSEGKIPETERATAALVAWLIGRKDVAAFIAGVATPEQVKEAEKDD